jgi:sulfoxide reductase catalytic subunit YedY
LQQAGFGLAVGASGLLSSPLLPATNNKSAPTKPNTGLKLPPYNKTKYGVGEKLTRYEDVTSYNNYYEFGTGKDEPAVNSKLFKPTPWTLSVEGEVKKNKTINIEDILKLAPLEERIYRMRCVEGWSMVIPWIGLPLAQLIKWAEPTANAKYVEFVSLDDVQQMPGINLPILDWPYLEGLRMDEAMNPLTIMAVGLYGDVLPNQNGAPMRLIVPWKYGFKGGKAIVKIRFTEKMPQTTWMKAGPSEYGFFANVNPQVEHPRWSQSTEKRIGNGLFAGRIKTQMFNGYEEQVGQMYAGMDLRKYF